jgi:hypothetical protein
VDVGCDSLAWGTRAPKKRSVQSEVCGALPSVGAGSSWTAGSRQLRVAFGSDYFEFAALESRLAKAEEVLLWQLKVPWSQIVPDGRLRVILFSFFSPR